MGFTCSLILENYSNAFTAPVAIESFSFDIEQTLNIGSQSTGAGAGKITFNPFSITRFPDLMSPVFVEDCSKGTPFKTLTLAVTPSGANQPVATYRLGLVAIKTISTSGSQRGTPLPIETVNFEYGSLQVVFHDIASNQTATGDWDRVHNVPGFYTG